MSVSQKVARIFAIFALLVLVLGGLSIRQLQVVSNDTDDIYSNYLTSIVNLGAAEAALQTIYVEQKSHIIAPNDTAMLQHEDTIAKNVKKMAKYMGLFEETLDPGLETETFKEFEALAKKIWQENDEILELSRTNDDEKADELSRTVFKEHYESAVEMIEAMLATNIEGSKKSFESSEKTFVWALVMIAVLSAVFLLSVFIVWRYTGGQFVKPLQRISAGIQKLADPNNTDKNISIGVDPSRTDEIGDLAQSFNGLLESSKELDILRQEEEQKREVELQRTNQVAELTSNFDAEVSNVIEAVSAAANEMESTAQSMRSQVRKSSEVADEAKAKAMLTSEQMGGLVEAANKIENVMDMISNVAEKTNLLALNASIESARAGEAGRGFAVVADEVKGLAEETVHATQDIGSEIQGIQQATREAETAIKEILEVVERINELSASVEGSVTEQGVATEDLAQQATVLSDAVNSFISQIRHD